MALHLYIVMTRLVFGSVVINTLDWDNSTSTRGAPSVCWEYSRGGCLWHFIFLLRSKNKAQTCWPKLWCCFSFSVGESYQLWVARCLFPLWHPVCCPLKKALLPSFLNVALNCVRNFGVVCVLLTFSVCCGMNKRHLEISITAQLCCCQLTLHKYNRNCLQMQSLRKENDLPFGQKEVSDIHINLRKLWALSLASHCR